MDHNYPSYSIPAPLIKDGAHALGDAIGDLTTTHTLIELMQAQVERLQDISRQSDIPASGLLPIYIQPGLASLWSFIEAIELRVRDSIILLQAIEEHEPEDGGVGASASPQSSH